MVFVRRALIILLTPILVVLLYATAINFGINRVVGQPAKVEKIIADSGVYNTAVSAALKQTKNVASDAGEVSLTDPLVQAAASTAFSPQLLQQNTNQFIDSVYAWLDGATTTPDFKIDFGLAKTAFADNIEKLAIAKANGLPKCTVPPSTLSFDVFSATCLPVGVTPSQAGAMAKDAIIGGKGFLDDPVITAADIKNGNSSQSVFNDQLKDLPQMYQEVKKAPILLALLALLLTIGMVFLYSNRRTGLRRVGIKYLVTAAIMLAFAWALNWGLDRKLMPQIKIDNAVVQTNVKSVVKDLGQAINKNFWLFGGVYGVIGALLIATPIINDRYRTKAKPAPTEAPGQPAPPSTPKKKTVKVQ